MLHKTISLFFFLICSSVILGCHFQHTGDSEILRQFGGGVGGVVVEVGPRVSILQMVTYTTNKEGKSKNVYNYVCM